MKVVLLAAGFATRLHPLTRDRAKPLLEVGGKPIAEHILDAALALPGVTECVVVTNARFHAQFERWLAGYDARVPVRLVANPALGNEQRLGAVRDLALALGAFEGELDEDVLVLAGDNLCELDLREHLELLARERRPVLACRLAGELPPPGKYGELELEPGSTRVRTFREKPADPRSRTLATGIYLFPPELRDWLAEYLATSPDGDSPGRFVEWLSRRTGLHALPLAGRWFDIGSLETLEAARRSFGG